MYEMLVSAKMDGLYGTAKETLRIYINTEKSKYQQFIGMTQSHKKIMAFVMKHYS